MKKYVLKKKRYLLFVSALDTIGAWISYPFKRIKPARLPDPVSRILLIRLDHIGDVILTIPVLKPLRKAFPRAKIDFIAAPWAIELLENHPCLDRVMEFNPVWFNREQSARLWQQLKAVFALTAIIKRGRYDVVIDFKGDLRHNLAMYLSQVKCRIGYGITGGGFLLSHEMDYQRGSHELEHNLELLKILGVRERNATMDIPLPEEAKQEAEKMLRDHGIPKRFAVVHAAAGQTKKNWNDAKFSALLAYLASQYDLASVMVGTARDTPLIQGIVLHAKSKAYDLSGKTDLHCLAGIIGQAALFVGVDSAPAHLSAALAIPTVVLFSGINDFKQWAPRGAHVRVVHPGKGEDLSRLSPEEVQRAVTEVYNGM